MGVMRSCDDFTCTLPAHSVLQGPFPHGSRTLLDLIRPERERMSETDGVRGHQIQAREICREREGGAAF